MRLPAALEFLRDTPAWRSVRDQRYLRRMRARSDFYRRLIPPQGLVFDVGANSGNYTLLFERLGARVLAIEPQAELAVALRRRFAGRKRVEILQVALGRAPTRAVLHKAPGLSEIASLRNDVAQRSRFAESHAFTTEESVAVVTLDSLLASHGVPDFCKIDVEGYEAEVFAGLSRPLPLLCFEFNREFSPETLESFARLQQFGGYTYNFAPADTPALAHPQWVDQTALLAHLQSSPDALLWGDIYARRN